MKNDNARVVLITGCSSGIGLALARELNRRGRIVHATALTAGEIAFLRDEGISTGACDVRQARSVKDCVRAVLKKRGRIDVLVNNAGIGVIGPVAELSLADLRRQFETNFFGAMALTLEVAPHMMERRSGIIVNMGSVSGVLATPFAGAYCASKAALHAVSDSLRAELAPFNISVVTVQPGAVKTNWGIAASKGLDRFGRGKSRYAPLAAEIEARAKTHLVNPTSAEELARRIADLLSRKKLPGIVRIGRESRRLPFLKWLLPQGVIDRMVIKRFKLDRLRV